MLFDLFKETIFAKKSSELELKYNVLKELQSLYPNNEELKQEFFVVKKGLDGEKEIEYQLEKSNLGIIVLHDINIEYENLKAQIDYIIITKAYTYFVECKNLIGNITVNEKGDFIREYTFNNKKIKKGLYSPLRQVEAQRDVYKKIWNNSLSKNKILNNVKRLLAEDKFTFYRRVLVVACNSETVINTKYAPKDIKNKVIKADGLIRYLQNDLEKSDKTLWSSKKEMMETADWFMKLNVENNIDYIEYYKNKFNLKDNNVNKEELKEELIKFRKSRSQEMKIPAYYIFTNDELEKIVEEEPKNIENLKGILSPIKIKTHGELIIEIINSL